MIDFIFMLYQQVVRFIQGSTEIRSTNVYVWFGLVWGIEELCFGFF